MDGCRTGVRIDDDFDAVLKTQKFDDVPATVVRFKNLQGCANSGFLEFAANFFGHPGGLGEIAYGASRSGRQAWVGIETNHDAFRFTGHENPQA